MAVIDFRALRISDFSVRARAAALSVQPMVTFEPLREVARRLVEFANRPVQFFPRRPLRERPALDFTLPAHPDDRLADEYEMVTLLLGPAIVAGQVLAVNFSIAAHPLISAGVILPSLFLPVLPSFFMFSVIDKLLSSSCRTFHHSLVQARTLRKKIEGSPSSPSYSQTVRSFARVVGQMETTVRRMRGLYFCHDYVPTSSLTEIGFFEFDGLPGQDLSSQVVDNGGYTYDEAAAVVADYRAYLNGVIRRA